MCTSIVSVSNGLEKNIFLKPDDLRILKEWMDKQSHLPKIDELQMTLFLESCDYSIENTKTCIEKYYTLRNHVPEFFKNRNPQTLGKAKRSVLMTKLPHFEPKCLFYLKLMGSNADNWDFGQSIKILDMYFWMVSRQLGRSPEVVAILDATGLTLGHLLKLNLVLVKKGLIYLEEACPVRLQAIHVINISPLVEKVYAVVKPLVGASLLNMLKFHSTLEEFYEHVPQKCMPNEYGGNAETIDELLEKEISDLEAAAELLLRDELLVANESKRLGKSQWELDGVFGIQGTFKKLDID